MGDSVPEGHIAICGGGITDISSPSEAAFLNDLLGVDFSGNVR